MMAMRCIIIDDEPLAREGMELLVKECGFLQLTGKCSNAMEANKMLSQQTIDLMFLDIQMPGMRGTDFLKTLAVKPLVIITTAYPNFALEGFELNVLDYLVKPITPERFLKAVNRALEVFNYRAPAGTGLPQTFFFIKCNHGYEKIQYDEILYVEAAQNYSCIYTPRGKFMTLTSLKLLEEQLPAAKFLRVQKSYIVAIDKIYAFIGNEIVIEKLKIPVSKNYKDGLMAIIDRTILKK